MSNTEKPATFVSTFVAAVVSLAPFAFVAFGKVYGNIKAQIEERDGEGTFEDQKFWDGGYTTETRTNKKTGAVTEVDTLEAQARRTLTSAFQGYNPKTGRPSFATDALATQAWGTIRKLVGHIRSESELNAAIETFGSMESVLRHVIVIGRVTAFATKVANAYGFKAKTLRVAGIAALDNSELAELHAKVAIAAIVDPSIKVSTFYSFVTETLKAKIEANKVSGQTPSALSAVA